MLQQNNLHNSNPKTRHKSQDEDKDRNVSNEENDNDPDKVRIKPKVDNVDADAQPVDKKRNGDQVIDNDNEVMEDLDEEFNDLAENDDHSENYKEDDINDITNGISDKNKNPITNQKDDDTKSTGFF